MKDEANLQTEKELYKLERRLKKVYREASEDIQKEMGVFLADFKKEDAIWKDQIKKGIKTEKQYMNWLEEKLFIGERWKAKQESMANTMFKANQAAANMVNQAMPEVFQINANHTAFNLEKQAGVDFGFDIYNAGAVKQLLQEDAKVLPFKKIKKSKDMRWNFQSIKNEVAKGIITGQSADDIADRLAKVIPNRNHTQLLTHARTMVTSAQNQGRMARLREAKNEKGINVKKKWLATLDMRTRFGHAILDGQVKDIDEPFIAEGYELMEPGDPTAAPALVYNCRCRLEEVLVDFPDEYTKRRDNETGELIEDMDYKTWYKMKTGEELGPDNTPLKKTQNKPPKIKKVKETPAAASKPAAKNTEMPKTEKPFEKLLTKTERRVLGKYQTQSFEFNQKLRSGIEWGKDQATAAEYKAMDKALAKAKIQKDTVVYRGVSGDTEAFFELKKGDTLTDAGYCSTTADKNMAKQYGDEVLFKINLKKGQPGAYISNIADEAGNTFEKNKETLLPRNSEFEVVNVTEREEVDETWGTKRIVREIELNYKGAKK